MKPPPFEYHAPETLPEALDLLGRLGSEAAPLAGGQSLVPLMNLRLARPANLVDLNRLQELSYVRVDDGLLRIGAIVRHAEMERSPVVRRALPAAPMVAAAIGHPAIRHRGTVVGSIAHGDPAAEWPCLALALDAGVTLAKTGATRVVPAAEFFTSFLTTVRQPDELLTEVAFSTAFNAWGFREFSRRAGDFALVGAAVALRISGGEVGEARVSVAGAGDRPLRVREAEQALVGRPLTDQAAGEAARAAARSVDPLTDIHGSADYRRELTGVMVERALNDALDRYAAPVEGQ